MQHLKFNQNKKNKIRVFLNLLVSNIYYIFIQDEFEPFKNEA